MRYPVIFALLISAMAWAGQQPAPVWIRDNTSNFFLKVNSDGTLNANIIPSGPGLTVNAPLSLTGPSGVPLLQSLFTDSLALCGSSLCLSGDTATPGNSKYYGTNSSGTLGYFALTAGSGTVTSASVVSANGFAGTVATATTTPAITLSTSITGVIKGNGTAISAATSGTDYSAGTSGLATGILKSTTTTGALTIAVAGDFPTLNQSTSGNAATATALAADPADCGANTFANAINASGTLSCASVPNAATTGVSTSTASTLVLRDGSADFAAHNITANQTIVGGYTITGAQMFTGSHNVWIDNGNGNMAFGGRPATPQMTDEFQFNDATTDVTTIIPNTGSVHNFPAATLRNQSNTVNTVSELAFQGQGTDSTAIDCAIVGRHVVQTAAGQTGQLEFWCRKAGGTFTKQFTIWPDGTIQHVVQAGGTTPTCAAAADDGKVAFTSGHIMCVCNASSWVKVSDGSTACTF